MASHMNSDVELLEYHDHKLTQIPENSIVVFQSMTPWSIFPNLKIHSEAKVVFGTVTLLILCLQCQVSDHLCKRMYYSAAIY